MGDWIKHRRVGAIRRGKSAEPIPLISIRRKAICFNKHFISLAELKEMTRVSVYLDPEGFRIGFAFHNNTEDDSAYILSPDGGGSSRKFYSLAIQATGLINQNSWIKAIAGIGDVGQRRFKPEWNNLDKKWIIRLSPAFEIHVSHKSEIPADTRGIYRYKRNDEIVYIGRGIIKSRLNSPERNDWDFDIIEYSPLQSEEAQEKWEAYWLDQFVEQNGKLPLYNRIKGKQVGG